MPAVVNLPPSFRRWLAAGTLAAFCLLETLASASAPRRIPLVIHVAQRDGEAVAPASFISEQLAAATLSAGASRSPSSSVASEAAQAAVSGSARLVSPNRAESSFRSLPCVATRR